MTQDVLANALAFAGRDESFRNEAFEALRKAELAAADSNHFRNEIRWPIVSALLGDSKYHLVRLSNGMKFEVAFDSRIERALLLSREAAPDHFWEPQTTKLLVALAAAAGDIIVGGAYIGDQIVPMAPVASARGGKVHAFEPMEYSFGRLVRNIQLNGIENVVMVRAGLWDRAGELFIAGEPALSETSDVGGNAPVGADVVPAIAADDYVRENGIAAVGLIMLDTEGGEEKALRGASGILTRPDAPNVVFEIHRNFVDWTHGLRPTPIISYLAELGYTSYAVRDYHDNVSTAGLPIEMIPVDRVYLEGPPHGFNMFATKDPGILKRLGVELVPDVSPKLLPHKDPRIHAPLRRQR